MINRTSCKHVAFDLSAPPTVRPCSRVCGFSLFFCFSCRYWDKEVLRAEKDARKPSLTKAIIKCYWKSYLVLGIFTLIEVKLLYTVCCFPVCADGYTDGSIAGDRGRWITV